MADDFPPIKQIDAHTLSDRIWFFSRGVCRKASTLWCSSIFAIVCGQRCREKLPTADKMFKILVMVVIESIQKAPKNSYCLM